MFAGRMALAAALLGTVVLAGCSNSESVSAVTPAKAQPAELKATAPQFYEASGPLVVENQVDVAALREGVVAKIDAEVGDRVRKGQKLAELDYRQLQADRDAAEAKVRSVQFELQHWQAEAQVRQSDLDRDEEMWKAQLITAKQVEHSRYAVQGANYETERERENLRNAQNTLRSVELELEKARIVAPFDGMVARRYVREGQKVVANDRLFWITSLSPIKVKFTVPQEFAGKLKHGEEVWVSSQAAPDRREAARISLISPVVDPSSGAIEVEALLAGATNELLPGMTVSIRVPQPR